MVWCGRYLAAIVRSSAGACRRAGLFRGRARLPLVAALHPDELVHHVDLKQKHL